MGYKHQPSLEALSVSAKTCKLCQLFLYALEEANGEYGPMPEEKRQGAESAVWLFGGDVEIFSQDEPKQLSQIHVQCGALGEDTVVGIYAYPGQLWTALQILVLLENVH